VPLTPLKSRLLTGIRPPAASRLRTGTGPVRSRVQTGLLTPTVDRLRTSVGPTVSRLQTAPPPAVPEGLSVTSTGDCGLLTVGIPGVFAEGARASVQSFGTGEYLPADLTLNAENAAVQVAVSADGLYRVQLTDEDGALLLDAYVLTLCRILHAYREENRLVARHVGRHHPDHLSPRWHTLRAIARTAQANHSTGDYATCQALVQAASPFLAADACAC
jgi:hypothetical protein